MHYSHMDKFVEKFFHASLDYELVKKRDYHRGLACKL